VCQKQANKQKHKDKQNVKKRGREKVGREGEEKPRRKTGEFFPSRRHSLLGEETL
jgi:hypothetical protein